MKTESQPWMEVGYWAMMAAVVYAYFNTKTTSKTTFHGLSSFGIKTVEGYVSQYPCLQTKPFWECMVGLTGFEAPDIIRTMMRGRQLGVSPRHSYGWSYNLAGRKAYPPPSGTGIAITFNTKGTGSVQANPQVSYYVGGVEQPEVPASVIQSVISAQRQGMNYDPTTDTIVPDIFSANQRGGRSPKRPPPSGTSTPTPVVSNPAPTRVPRVPSRQNRQTLVGMTESQAVTALGQIGYTTWILARDGKAIGLPLGQNPKRVNLDIYGGIVRGYYVG